MVFKVRVRGVYSTAISKILYDRGITLVDVSDVIASRLGISQLRGEAADITIKSDDNDPSNILVIGFPKAVKFVVNVLVNTIPYVIALIPNIGLYTTFKTYVVDKKDGECLVETPVGPAPVVDVSDCVKGMELPVTSIKVPLRRGENPVFSSKLRVVGYYAILGRGGKITFSNHIRNKSRVSELVTLSTSYVRRGYSIHWRSNVDEANLEEVLKELEKLITLLNDVEKAVSSSKALEIVYEGEAVALLILSSLSKKYLDSIRELVTPTTPYHHQLKCVSEGFSDVVDLLDMLSTEVCKESLSKAIKKWLVSKLLGFEVTLKHVKPDGTLLTLGSGRVLKAYLDVEDNICVHIERDVRGRGVYDGIEVPKELGDRIVSEVCEGRWWIKHTYLSQSGVVKGEYVNINTPPEILPSGIVKYVDLGLDLVRRGSVCRLIDANEFRELVVSGLIREGILNEVLSSLSKLVNTLCST